MKSICTIIFFFFLGGFDSFSQLGLTMNYEDILDETKKLKSIKTMYYQSEDTTKSEGKILFKKEFDFEGKLILKYVFTFWDVVSYDHTTTYQYDDFGYLIEQTSMQKIMNLGKRDDKYIKYFGDEPINEKWFFSYDSLNRLVKETNYYFSENKLDSSTNPMNTIEYFYNDKNKLIKEISTDCITTYKYDTHGNKIEEILKYKKTIHVEPQHINIIKKIFWLKKKQLMKEFLLIMST